MKTHQIVAIAGENTERQSPFAIQGRKHIVVVYSDLVKPHERLAVAEVLEKHASMDPQETCEGLARAEGDTAVIFSDSDTEGTSRERALKLITQLRAILGAERCAAGPVEIGPGNKMQQPTLSYEWPNDEE